MAYATTADVEARWRPLSPAEATQAAALLDDAAVVIRAACPDIADRITDGLLDPSVPKLISVRLVKRVMSAAASSGFEGVTNLSQTAGPFSQNTSFANPLGEMFLTKADRRLLGCGGAQAFTVDMAPDAVWPTIEDE